MGSIEDFVDKRWADAKEDLRRVDSGFVTRIESTLGLSALKLTAPWSLSDMERKPTRRLSNKWHLLLEACGELVMQVAILEESVAVLTKDEHHSASPVRAGRQALFHFRSWVIHAQALTERVSGVINCSAKVYLSDSRTHKELVRYYNKQVQEVAKHLNNIRNEYLHPNRSWGVGITEDQLWEGIVAVGLTPKMMQDDYIFPEQGEFLKSKKYTYFIIPTDDLYNRLGSLLEEFDGHISNP